MIPPRGQSHCQGLGNNGTVTHHVLHKLFFYQHIVTGKTVSCAKTCISNQFSEEERGIGVFILCFIQFK